MSSLFRMEKRLSRDTSRAAAYAAFMHEYRDLEHMTAVSSGDEPQCNPVHYIPHHAVFREQSSTTRLRVVFNASNATSNGRSLNECLLPGPKLQTDLMAIILRWRQFRFVLTADITKMFRQIRIDPRDADWQRVFWRGSPSEPVDEYRLLTVTYGTVSAPFLSIRVLRQLTIDEGAPYPLAVSVVHRQMYVDDCIFGADSQELAIQTRDQLIELLRKGGFPLRKWSTNQPSLLTDLDPSDCESTCSKELACDESLKILGISWHPHRDAFTYTFVSPSSPPCTKRSILSLIATMFDPLGWITPCTIKAKILIQNLWARGCAWDAEIPRDLCEDWLDFFSQLPAFELVSIPRWTRCENGCQVQIHGFADASTKAYAAAIYLRVQDPSGTVVTSLLVGKSKVAPIKSIITIPRLELCAALLLATLLTYTRDALDLRDATCCCWSDSAVTLHWLRQPASKWQPFVAHRVAKIQEMTDRVQWRHVPTEDNPADCASRGLLPSELPNHPLWWSGPSWLCDPPDQWPQSMPVADAKENLEERMAVVSHIATAPPPWELQARFSCWYRLVRVTALVMHFVNRLRKKPGLSPSSSSLSVGVTSSIVSSPEMLAASVFWLRRIQATVFPTELAALKTTVAIPRASPLSPLCPFLAEDGLIRVRGRLRNAPWSDDKRYPIVIGSHPLVKLLIRSTHLRLLHAGPHMTLAYLRRRYWLLRARQLVRGELYHCVPCTRSRAQPATEFMGDLPSYRVTAAARAFIHTGVDYAGPIFVRYHSGRGHKAHKAYIALFVCMTTKALHLELVSEYTTAAFLAAFQRFVSRRGRPTDLYSDNGTNFRKADRELATAHRAAISDPDVAHRLMDEQITWHFMPPGAPHFGGLWEASVRNVKAHLTRCIGAHTLTFEEMTTLLCKVEASLNSRPIAKTSDNLDDFHVLTPGHFLVLTDLLSTPEPSVLDVREARLSRWQMVQRLHDQFWSAWSREYLHTLHQRPKWRTRQHLTTVGQIVLLRDVNLPPSKWALGRITKCFPGTDGVVRVVNVTTSTATYRRPITKICFLPLHINDAESTESQTAGGRSVTRPVLPSPSSTAGGILV